MIGEELAVVPVLGGPSPKLFWISVKSAKFLGKASAGRLIWHTILDDERSVLILRTDDQLFGVHLLELLETGRAVRVPTRRDQSRRPLGCIVLLRA